jgi:fibronectin type 3 domain-containing protein
VSLASNASDSNAQEALSGVGITPVYNVTVSWSASTSQVAGYNIYRGISTSSYAKMNSAVNPSTTFTDTNVTAGQTYYYVATAVNSAGQESPYSTPVQAVVP